MNEDQSTSANNDLEARLALWKAILVATDDVRHRFSITDILDLNGTSVGPTSPIPDVATWQLVEALSLLCIILRSSEAQAGSIDIFGKTGPIEIIEDGVHRYLWAQQTLRGEHSALTGRPDLIVTSSSGLPHPGNAVRVTEAKCVRQLGIPVIRAEFGKAHDLKVATYFIWTFYTPSPALVEGAKGLGIDLEELGFNSEHRADLLASPEALISHVAHAQEQARRTERFALMLRDAGEQANRKLLGPGPRDSGAA